MNRRVKIGIMVALMVLAVGFAAVTTTLIINGTLTIASDQAGFDKDVIFTKAKTNGKAFITDNGKTIEFSADLQDIGEEDDLRYEITNKNRQYDASGTIECDFIDPDNRLNEYITITPSPESFEIEASRKKTGHVVVRMVKSFIGDDDVVGDTDPANIGEIGFKCTIKLEAGERENLAPEVVPVYTDATLNGADPTVGGDLIPVTIAENGTVTYADEYEEWYNYRNKQWANAVLLEDGVAFKYDTGDVIKEEDIESYFVWVPRYRYKLWNVDGTGVTVANAPEPSNAKAIDIVFETKDVEASTGTQNGEWLTHPAFTSLDVNGIWVGKYETTIKGATSNSQTASNGVNPTKVAIKPNSYPWRNNNIGSSFLTMYNYARQLDSHLIKNTEWGAVAYLSHSEYGIGKEVTINKINYTGAASKTLALCVKNEDSCNPPAYTAAQVHLFNTEGGYQASTTGNITGIYDMSGGLKEYVAAYVEGGNMKFLPKASDLETYAKYFDVYPANSTTTSYANRILGDATGEMGPFYTYADNDDITRTHNSWYADNAVFVDETNSIFVRGGGTTNGSLAGQFSFETGTGIYNGLIGFRGVLAPQ